MAGVILVLAVAVVMLLALTGTAGGAPTTLPTDSVSLAVTALGEEAPAGEAASEASEDSGAGASAAIFSLSAQDLGDFSGEAPELSSPAAVVVNMSTGRVLYERKADEKRPMASTTKIMTAVLILENLPLDKKVTVSEKAAHTSEVKPFLKPGDVLTVEQLLYSLMVHSSNSAAMALAEALDGSVEAFAERMNRKAADLGMEDTHFVNPSGLDSNGHYSTASDMAGLGLYAMKNDQFRKLVGTREYTLEIPERGQSLVFENTNKLMLTEGRGWVTGVKTGLTPRAEQCLVASGTKNGVSILSVVLGQPSTSICWNESEALLEYGFSQYRHLTFLDEGIAVAEAEVPYHVGGTVRLVTDGALEMDVYKEDDVTAKVELDRDLVLPVQAGESYGRVVLAVGDETVGAVDLVADGSYEEPRLSTKVVYVWDRFARWVGGIF